MRTSQKITGIVTTIGIDIGKNTFHLVGFDQRGAHHSAAEGVTQSARTPCRQYSTLPNRHGGLLGLPSHRSAAG
jgi:hypothetical protein